MHLCYFDENKYSEDRPHFFIGGLLIPDKTAAKFEDTLSNIVFNFFGSQKMTHQTELHGKDLFHGKGNAKSRDLTSRVQVFKEVADFVCDNQIPVRMICIDVKRHKEKYADPTPEYQLGLMLMLERISEYLDSVDDVGLVFGDYEADQVTQSVVDFSEFKTEGRTPMYFSRPLGRILDTVYFTHSHHSRFLQVADLLVYMAGRYEKPTGLKASWHEQEVFSAWSMVRASENFKIKYWP